MDGLAKVPWEGRQSRVIFRGANKADSIAFPANAGEHSIRGRAAVLALGRPDLMDIKFFDVVCKPPQPANCRDPDVSVDAYAG